MLLRGRLSTRVALLLAIALLLCFQRSSAARAQSTQAIETCPVPNPVASLALCIDRGEGAFYLEGDPITVCVTVNAPMVLTFPPPPAPLARLSVFVEGVQRAVLLEGRLATGRRCINGVISPPFGREELRGELIGADGSRIATASVSYRSVARLSIPVEIAVTIDRGAGAVYVVGEPITICVTVSPRDGFTRYRVRLINLVDSGFIRTVDLGLLIGQHCTVSQISPPVGRESIRAEALDPVSGQVMAADAVELISVVQPVPAPPAAFFGSVTLHGQPAPAGTPVEAFINRALCGTATTTMTGNQASYAIDVASAATRPGCGSQGAAVTFRIAGVEASETGTFQSGAFVTLNLSTGEPAAQPPPAPTTLRVTFTDATHVQLVWTDNSGDETSFRIYEGFTQIASVGPNITVYLVSDLSPRSYHCFRVSAIRGSLESPPSDWRCVTGDRDGAVTAPGLGVTPGQPD